MKKLSIYFSCLLLAVLLSCSDDVLVQQEVEQLPKNQDLNSAANNARHQSGGEFCFYRPDFGTLRIYRDTTSSSWIAECEGSGYSCRLFRRPTCVNLDPCALGLCQWDPFVDPWELAQIIDPLKLPSIRDFIDQDVSEQFIMIPLNHDVLLLQFYKEQGDFLKKDGLHLSASMDIDDKYTSGYNLNGNVIPANKYPVLYNKKHGTFNALVSVSKYPITYDRKVTQILPAKFKGSLNDLFKDYKMNVLKDAKLVESTIEYFDIQPYLTQGANGIYAFSNGLNDLNMIFYGDPSPQPSKFDPTPTPMKIWLEKEVWLPQTIAKELNIKSFLIKPENLFQSFDKETGILRVKIMNR